LRLKLNMADERVGLAQQFLKMEENNIEAIRCELSELFKKQAETLAKDTSEFSSTSKDWTTYDKRMQRISVLQSQLETLARTKKHIH
jgi:hypothetical protein